MRIVAISDTHSQHKAVTDDLPGGDLLIHAGDWTSGGYKFEIKDFLKWIHNRTFDFDYVTYIAGNHDRLVEDSPSKFRELLNEKFPNKHSIKYLQDEEIEVDFMNDEKVKIYGSPWQPEFHDWAFNLKRGGDEIWEKWQAIPEDTDILVTHGPPFSRLDLSLYGHRNVGCELLNMRVQTIKPKIHIFGHVHSSYGYSFDGNTHYINACVLNEQYKYKNKPIVFDWNPITNEIKFV